MTIKKDQNVKADSSTLVAAQATQAPAAVKPAVKSIFEIKVDKKAEAEATKTSTPMWEEVVEEIKYHFPQLNVKYLTGYVAFYHNGRKVFNVNTSRKNRTFFHYSGADQVAAILATEGLRSVDRKEATREHWGNASALYEGNCILPILEMISVWAWNIAKIS